MNVFVKNATANCVVSMLNCNIINMFNSVMFPSVLLCNMHADRAGDIIDRKSICGIVFKFGNRTINWISKKQYTYCSSVVYRSWVCSKLCSPENCVDAYFIERLRIPSDRTNTRLREDNLSCIRFIKKWKSLCTKWTDRC